MALNESEHSDAKPNLASRLGPAHINLRNDLEVHRHLFNKQVAYIIRDPLTLQSHRINKAEYKILVQLNDEKSLAEIFENLVETKLLNSDDEDRFYEFVVTLHQLAFLNLPISNNKTLYRRHQSKLQAKRHAKIMGFLFLQIPLINPNTFLDNTLHHAKHLFHRSFFLIWAALMLLGTTIVCLKHKELLAPFQTLRASNLISMWVILIFLKVIHEFGHAYACKIRGGYVSEMGIYMIAMTPCAYVDVSSSWGFPRKLDRIIVGLGGMYFESLIALIALFVWALSGQTSVGSLAHQVFFLSGIVTILMNINPLMRFDGYYILSDLLEIPNLRQRSQNFTLGILKKIFLGIKPPASNHGLGMKLFLTLFGTAGSLYKITVVLGISMAIATKAFLLGMIMAGIYIFLEIIKLSKRIYLYLWKSPEVSDVRFRATALGVAFFLGLPAIIFWLPIPSYVQSPGQLTRQKEHVARARQDGFIRQINYQSATWVNPQSPLVTLENTQIQLAVLEAQANLTEGKIQLDTYLKHNSSSLEIARQRKINDALQSELDLYQTKKSRLIVQSETEGEIIDMVENKDLGRFIKAGEPLATIVSGPWMIYVLLSGEELATIQPQLDQSVEFRTAAQPGVVLEGKITTISPSGTQVIDSPVLTSLGEGTIPVNMKTHQTPVPYFKLRIALNSPPENKLAYGMTGHVRFPAPAEPLGLTLTQKVLRFLHRLHQ